MTEAPDDAAVAANADLDRLVRRLRRPPVPGLTLRRLSIPRLTLRGLSIPRLTVLRLEGCGGGCGPDHECSAGRAVGGPTADAVRAGVEVVVPSWCLTQTSVEPHP